MPSGENREEISEFVKSVINPIEFNSIEVKDNSVVVSAGRQSKAALIGRNRSREKEMSDILKNLFGVGKFRVS